MSSRTAYINAALLFLWTALFYHRLAHGYFVAEDYNYLLYARYPLSVSPLQPFCMDYLCGMWFRPLVTTLWVISWRIAGFAVWGHYAIDTAILWLSALLLVRISRQLGASAGTAFFAAALFIAHPITGATLSYLAARGDMMGTFFALASLSAHIQSRKSKNVALWRIGAILAASAAYLSKEMFLIIPLLIMVIPHEKPGKRGIYSLLDHIIEGAPYLLAAIGVFIWREAILGGVLGGYMYKRSDVSFYILKTPSHALQTAIRTPKMIAAYGLSLFGSPVTRLMIGLLGAAGLTGWLLGGLSRLRSPFALMALCWTALSILPVTNFHDVLGLSPHLLYFPLTLFLLWLALLRPERKKIIPVTLIMLLAAWIPLNFNAITLALQKADRFRKLSKATQEFYLPGILKGRDNQNIVVFGVPPEAYSLDLMYLDTLPKELDPKTSPAFTAKFLYGDRVTMVSVLRRPGDSAPEKVSENLYDYETRDHIKVFKNDVIYVEVAKAPDILKLLAEGKDIKVGYYDAATGKYRDIIDLFRYINFQRAIALQQTNVFPKWTITEALYTWRPNKQLERLLSEKTALFRSTGNDPYLTLSYVLIDPLPIQQFDIKMRIERTNLFFPLVQAAFLSWESEKKPPFGLKQSISFPIKADGEWHTYQVKVGAWPGWYMGGRVTSLRLDPITTPANVELESIFAIPCPAPKALP